MTRKATTRDEPALPEIDKEEPARVLLHMPVDVRSLSLAVIAVLATIFALNWAKPILVPILLGVMFSYALTPVVERLHRWRIPRALAASVVLSAILAFLGWGTWALSDDAQALVATLPEVAQKVRRGLEGQGRNPAGATIEKMQQAANELEQAAAAAASGASATPASSPASSGSTSRTRVGGSTTTTTTTSTTLPTTHGRAGKQRHPRSSSSSPSSTCATTSGAARSACSPFSASSRSSSS